MWWTALEMGNILNKGNELQCDGLSSFCEVFLKKSVLRIMFIYSKLLFTQIMFDWQTYESIKRYGNIKLYENDI